MKSTSSPHKSCAAGIYTSPILLPLVAHLLESFGAIDKLQNFVSTFGRTFYRLDTQAQSREFVELKKMENEVKVQDNFSLGEETVVPFWAGEKIRWEVVGWGHDHETL